MKDRQGACQIAVPAEWVSGKLVASFMMATDGKANAVAHGQRSGKSFADAILPARQAMAPSKMIKNSAKRVWYAYSRRWKGPPRRLR